MASLSVMQAVRARLEAGWTRCPIIHPNAQAQTPGGTDPWLVVQYPMAREEQASIGSPGANLFREEGAIRLVLMVPAGSGVEEWTGWLDELRALFRAARFGGVRTYAPSPAVFDDRNRDGGWCALSTAIPYDADIRA